uniref:G_PROTEIN_RECEP_F1_2 domain-containing protein n=1 Tax=Globodera pallida TaxID=36090 RepID=A0A183BTA6_GLOPA
MGLLLEPPKRPSVEWSWPTSAQSLSPATTSTSCCAETVSGTAVGDSGGAQGKSHPQSLPQHLSSTNNAPAWRLEMRSRIFRTTVHVIAAYLICWLPYNVLALATFFSKQLQITITVHLELLRICVLLNALLNPFIYGFKKGQDRQIVFVAFCKPPPSVLAPSAANSIRTKTKSTKMDYEARIKAYRFVAYSTVSFSIISLLSVCFTLPMLKNYVANVALNMDRELNSCQLVKPVATEVRAQCPEEAEAEGLAANVVLAEDRAQPDPRDRLGAPEIKELQEHLDSQEKRNLLLVNRPLRLPANRALVVNPDSLGLPDQLDNLEGQDSPETPAEIPSLDLPDPLDHLETREDPVNPEDLVSQDSLQHQRQLAPLLLARLERLEPRDSLETPARPANPEDLDSPAPKGPPGSPGQPGNDGQPGQPGSAGQPGGAGEKGICPKYCAIDGGVFFEDGTRRR